MSQIVIHSIQGEPNIYNGVSKNNGKPYTIWTYTCTGTVDGVQTNPMMVKTRSQQMTAKIIVGFAGYAELDNFSGKITYLVKPPEQAQSQPAPAGASGNAPSNAGQSRGWMPPAAEGYSSFEEMEALFTRCFDSSGDFLPEGLDPFQAMDIRSRLTSTLLIACQKAGIKATASPAVATVDPVLQQIHTALMESNLVDKVAAAGFTDENYRLWMQQAGNAKDMFIIRVQGELLNLQ